MLKNFRKFGNSVNYLGLRAIDREISEFSGFFEHYSVWCTSHLKISDCFEHCGVLMHHSSHNPHQKNAQIWIMGGVEHIYIYTHTYLFVAVSILRSLYIYIYIYLYT